MLQYTQAKFQWKVNWELHRKFNFNVKMCFHTFFGDLMNEIFLIKSAFKIQFFETESDQIQTYESLQNIISFCRYGSHSDFCCFKTLRDAQGGKLICICPEPLTCGKYHRCSSEWATRSDRCHWPLQRSHHFGFETSLDGHQNCQDAERSWMIAVAHLSVITINATTAVKIWLTLIFPMISRSESAGDV